MRSADIPELTLGRDDMPDMLGHRMPMVARLHAARKGRGFVCQTLKPQKFDCSFLRKGRRPMRFLRKGRRPISFLRKGRRPIRSSAC